MIERADVPAEAPPPDEDGKALALQTLAQLNEQADVVRSDIAVLRLDLAQVERDYHATPGTLLREANEQLVLAAMRSEVIADTATRELDELSRARVGTGLAQLRQSAELAQMEFEQGMRELREANEHLVLAALRSQELEATALEAHRRQISFLAMVAHELRNPLMPLRIAALMLDRARNDELAHAKLQATISGQVAQMARLIGDLLEGSRISTGQFRLERVPVDIVGILERAIETCQPAMDERRHTFTCELQPGPVMILADSARLVQVFSNLLENSSKYTPEGGAIALRMAARGETIVVTIADNGIGITAKALPHVFDMFMRDAHATTVDHAGLGIGLAVVRELVRAHEGTVVARSAGEGQGSEFTVTLPLPAGFSARATP